MVLVAGAFLLGWIVLTRLPIGIRIYALGNDARMLRQSGADERKVRVATLLIMGVFTAAGMVVMLGRFGAAAPTAGFGLELDAIVAVVIGGASFRGGEGRLRDTAIGVLFLAVLNNGLSGLQMGDAQFFMIKGSAILAALTLRAAARIAARRAGTARMTVDYGHTSFEAAFVRGDVYGVRPDPQRAAKRPLSLAIVGCGGVAQAKWLPAIRRLQTIGEPIALFGVVDPDEAARDKVGSLWSTPHLSIADRPARSRQA